MKKVVSMLKRRPFAGIQSWRLISTLICVLVVFNLFYLGAKPIAVGLFAPPMDKVAHFVTFSMIAALLWAGLLRGRPWLLVILACAIAGADEIHQIYLPGRAAGFDDFAADAVAVILTTLLLVWRNRASASGTGH